jgi:hypothetical protein
LWAKQGCQMVCFQTKNPNLGKFWKALEWKMLVYLMVIWNMLWSFGICYGHLEYVMVIWNILRSFGIFYGHLVMLYLIYFPSFWYIVSRKIWQTCGKVHTYKMLQSLFLHARCYVSMSTSKCQLSKY